MGLTISAEQAALACERPHGLDFRVLEADYLRHEGSSTKVASIEMLEAIGEEPLGHELRGRVVDPHAVRRSADADTAV